MTMTARLIIGAVTDFMLTATAVLTGAMATNGTIAMPSDAVWLLSLLFGLGAAAKHARAMLIDPKVIILIAALSLTGCASQLRELSKDGASVCARVKAVLYGEAAICRTNTPGEAVIGVDKDGSVSVKHRGSAQP